MDVHRRAAVLWSDVLSPTGRWLLVAMTFGFGVHLLTQGQWFGAIFLASGTLLLAGHWLYGSVRVAFLALRRGDMGRAASLIERTPDTRLLTKESRAYRAWILAALAEARGQLEAAVDHLEDAIELGLRTKNDRVLAFGTQAALLAKLGERERAEARLAEAQALGPTERQQQLLAKVTELLDG